jgi:micrococcal nuclease
VPDRTRPRAASRRFPSFRSPSIVSGFRRHGIVSRAVRKTQHATGRVAIGRGTAAGALAVVGVVAVVAVVAVFLLGPPLGPIGSGEGSGPGRDSSAAGSATIVRVVDGDTVVVAIHDAHEPVRLIGIDTPETVAPDQPDECFGGEASARLADLLPPDTEVRLSRDVEPRDVYDRLLAYVERAADGLFVNLAQVADGYAVASDYPPNVAHRDEFEQAERAAREAGLGLWSACGGADVALTAHPGASRSARARGP